MIGDGAASVRASLMQYPDGRLEIDDDQSPAIHIDVCRDWGVTRAQAREVAAAIIAAADEASQRQAAGPSIGAASIGIWNRRTDRIFDIDVVKFIHSGQEMDLEPARVNGFSVFPRREKDKEWFNVATELPGVTLDTDEWLVIHQQGSLPNIPADYAAVQYTDSVGRRWEVDTDGEVTRI